MARSCRSSRIVYAAGGGPDKRCYRVDFGRPRPELPGFAPTWTVPAGIEELLAAIAPTD